MIDQACVVWVDVGDVCGFHLKISIFFQPTDDPPSPSLWLFHVLTHHGQSPGVQDGRFKRRIHKTFFGTKRL